MWLNRKHMLGRIEELHEDRPGRPLRERVAELDRAGLQTMAIPTVTRA
jgi:hypothetical protein